METTPTGAAPDPQLAPQAPASPAQLPQQQTTQTASQAPATQAVAPSPEITALQAELANAKKIAADHQAAYTRAQQEAVQTKQQLQALVGQAPQQDPLAPYLKVYADNGFSGDDAKFLAQRDYQTDQRFQALQGSMQAQNAVPNIMQAIYQSNPQLCANQVAVQEMQAALQQAAANGRPDLVNMEYALSMGYIADGRTRYAQPNPNPQQPPRPAPNFNSMTGINSPFSGAQPQHSQTAGLAPHLQAARDAEMAIVRQNHNLPPKQP